MSSLPQHEWIRRCIAHLIQIEPEMDDDAAAALAQDMFDFERTAAMAPESAVEFVRLHLGQTEQRLERRSKPRPSR